MCSPTTSTGEDRLGGRTEAAQAVTRSLERRIEIVVLPADAALDLLHHHDPFDGATRE